MENILFIDLETTALSLWKARIVQIGLIYKGQSKSILINPQIPIPQEASNIHHIYDKDVANAQSFQNVSQNLLKLILECDCVIGYNIRNYDWNILYMEFQRCGITLPEKDIIDVYEQVQLFEPNKKLSGVYLRYFNETLSGAHDGLVDCFATKRIYEYLQSKTSL